ncbi:MetS family NSS transporter small subunit [Numidum massiliense]|nr:MetS family NSS transporter small subunit [Numidum massiliense]
MSVSAWIMFGVGAVLLWGGLIASIVHAMRASKKRAHKEDTHSTVSS